jgi:hypothetical protein
VVARALDNPRKLWVGPHGEIFVAEAGAGGRVNCRGARTARVCIGRTGSITEIAGGGQTRVVVGLPSVSTLDEQRAAGPAAALVRGGVFYVLLQDVEMNRKADNGLGAAGRALGSLVVTGPGLARPRVVANLAGYEAAHNPDHGAGPGTALGDPAIDSDPYGFVPYRGGFAIVDAAANDLLWVSPKGKVSVLAVFPTQRAKVTSEDRRAFGLPNGMRSIEAQSVPSSVTTGPDGALYVGELTGVPFEPGTARVWRVVPGSRPTVYASGFTSISDIAFDGSALLVLEIASTGLAHPVWPGALIQVAPNGRRTVLASRGLYAPTGLAVRRGSIYISNYGTFPGAGPGPHGEVVRLRAGPAASGSR